MELVIEIIRPVVRLLMVPVNKCMGFVVSSSTYVRKMHTRMNQLDTTAADVKIHMETNNANNLEIPHRIPDWLDDVKMIKAQVGRIPTVGNGCFDVKMRYNAGKRSSDILEEIERLIKEASEIKWTNKQKPLGRVDSKKTSTSDPFDDGAQSSNFESRDMIFKDALKPLQPNDKTQKIALCGMGGVGKTTMMEQLKKFVEDSKMFDWVVKVVIGQNPNPIVVQQAVSEQLGEPLTETIKDTRAERLGKKFKSISDDGKKNILVILDDLWEEVDLKDIGLMNPLPHNFKLLLTSREGQVCTNMGVEAKSIIRMEVLKDSEAKILFNKIAGIFYGGDPELHEIGEDIIKRCRGLPIAIKTIASALRDNYEKDAWEDARTRLQHNDSKVLDKIVHEIFEISYNNLKEDDDKSIFLLCGLFPDDFNIPIEELMRYAWGLKLFDKVYTLQQARSRVNTCVGKLIRANLLSESDWKGCVNMHDLVRAFVLSNPSEVKQASVVDHCNMSQWPTVDTSKSYVRILLKCTGMLEFPVDFNYPNLKLMKLMDGDRLLKYPHDFYQRMGNLEVVSYEMMRSPFPLIIPQYSTKLRTLCLFSCSLSDDFSFLGDLINLEILSIAHCGMEKLPSTIGKLRKLKLLDLTVNYYRQIDYGVFKNLVNLEELYMKFSDERADWFLDANCEELEMLSRKLVALEVEFINKDKPLPKNLSLKNLERFKISMGCLFEDVAIKDEYSYNNTLNLVTNRDELLECKINELFNKTERLHLKVKDMIGLDEVSSQHSFSNLRVLKVRKCVDLRYLFTIPVASGLTKLEHLAISNCPVLTTLVHGENSGTEAVGMIKFQELKFLQLDTLPKLVCLCDNDNVVELPQLVELRLFGLPNITSIYPGNTTGATQAFFKKEILIPKLEKLEINRMEKLKQIWPYLITSTAEVQVSMLREIEVINCDSLVNLFPCNPLPKLSHLDKLVLKYCDSIRVLFNFDLGRVGEIKEEVSRSSSRLRSIEVRDAGKLREVWRIKGANNSPGLIITGFQAVERIGIIDCKCFRNVFSPPTINFDLGALMHLFLNGKGVEVVFEIESPTSRERPITQETQQPSLLPNLETLCLYEMEKMSYVWKCNWNQLLLLQKHQPNSSLQNLTCIDMYRCNSIRYLFSPLMAKLLSNLKEVSIRDCDGFEEVVSCRDDENEEITTSTSTNRCTNLFPRLHLIDLDDLKNLKRIGGGGGCAKGWRAETSFNSTTTTDVIDDELKFSQVGVVPWSLCQYSKEISIKECDALSSVIPFYALRHMQKLEVLRIGCCESMIEVFETQGIKNSVHDSGTNNDDGRFGTNTTPSIPRIESSIMLKPLNLKILEIERCGLLEHICTFSAVESLRQLEELTIESCNAMKVIMKEENGEQPTSSAVVVFPRLKSIKFVDLPNLAGFYFGMNEFWWPLLDKVTIRECPQMMVFTSGESTAPKLKYIHKHFGKYGVEYGLNIHVATNFNQGLQLTPFRSLDGTSSCPTTYDGVPWSFHNLVELEVEHNYEVKKIIPLSNIELLELEKLERIQVKNCYQVEEVFEGITSGFSKPQTIVKFPNLREMDLEWLTDLKNIWKGNQWMILEFPKLTRVSIRKCDRLEYVFTCSMVGSLLQLQELSISSCDNMEVIVKEEKEEDGDGDGDDDGDGDGDGKVNEIMLPCLKSLKLKNLWGLEGFCLGKEAFSLPSLDYLKIKDCSRIKTFTNGHSTVREQTVVKTSFGRFKGGKDINSLIKTKKQLSYEEEEVHEFHRF